MRKAALRTEHLELVLRTPEEVLASVEAMSPSDRAEVSPDWLARAQAAGLPDPWLHGFAIVHRASGVEIGSCGFKGPPGSGSVVEIAYGVHPGHQGRGYATEAARALSNYAFDTGGVSVVCAHTRPAGNASARVLTKCGFTRIGEVVDPEDGLVWRWELRRSQKASRRQSWVNAALSGGALYFVIGRVFTWPASHLREWRLVAWLLSGAVLAAHVAYEHFRLRNPARAAAAHAAVAVAMGGFALAVGGAIRSFLVAHTLRPTWILALLVWPLLTGVPAFLAALVAASFLERFSPNRSSA